MTRRRRTAVLIALLLPAVQAAREAHVMLATNDAEDPDIPPRSLDVLRIMTGSA